MQLYIMCKNIYMKSGWCLQHDGFFYHIFHALSWVGARSLGVMTLRRVLHQRKRSPCRIPADESRWNRWNTVLGKGHHFKQAPSKTFVPSSVVSRNMVKHGGWFLFVWQICWGWPKDSCTMFWQASDGKVNDRHPSKPTQRRPTTSSAVSQ